MPVPLLIGTAAAVSYLMLLIITSIAAVCAFFIGYFWSSTPTTTESQEELRQLGQVDNNQRRERDKAMQDMAAGAQELIVTIQRPQNCNMRKSSKTPSFLKKMQRITRPPHNNYLRLAN